MTVYRECWPLLLVALFAGWSFGTVNGAKLACRGDSVELFQNIQVDSVYTVLIVYVNGEDYKQIAMWFVYNSVVNSTFVNGYRERLSLDQYGNIWIHDLHDSDEGNYIIECTTRYSTRKHNTTLSVLVAPETRCKPKIVRGVDSLTTYLEPDGCGKPAASVYWLEQPGISVERNEIKLLAGHEAGTVYACIDSPALKCAKNSKLSDYCSVFKDESRIQSRVTELSAMTTGTLVIIICVSIVVIVGIPIIIIQCKRLKHMLKKNAKSEFFPEATRLLPGNGIPSQGPGSVSDDTGVESHGSAATVTNSFV